MYLRGKICGHFAAKCILKIVDAKDFSLNDSLWNFSLYKLLYVVCTHAGVYHTYQ